MSRSGTLDDCALPFREAVRIRFRDTDAQGHLYFANYLVLADETMGIYMETLGFRGATPHEAERMVFTVNAQCDYLHECGAGAEVVVCVGYAALGNASATMAYALYLADDGRALARGTMTQVFVDPATRKASPIPPSMRAAVLERQPELGEAAAN